MKESEVSKNEVYYRLQTEPSSQAYLLNKPQQENENVDEHE